MLIFQVDLEFFFLHCWVLLYYQCFGDYSHAKNCSNSDAFQVVLEGGSKYFFFLCSQFHQF